MLVLMMAMSQMVIAPSSVAQAEPRSINATGWALADVSVSVETHGYGGSYGNHFSSIQKGYYYDMSIGNNASTNVSAEVNITGVTIKPGIWSEFALSNQVSSTLVGTNIDTVYGEGEQKDIDYQSDFSGGIGLMANLPETFTKGPVTASGGTETVSFGIRADNGGLSTNYPIGSRSVTVPAHTAPTYSVTMIGPANPANNSVRADTIYNSQTTTHIVQNVKVRVSYQINDHVIPTITAANHTITTADPVPGIAYSDGVTPRSGATNTLFNGYNSGTYNGTVTLQNAAGLVSGLPSASIGRFTQTLRATDVADPPNSAYPSYTAYRETTRIITVLATTAPAFVITYAPGATDPSGAPIGGNAYAGEWTNQALTMVASHTDSGTYNTAIKKDASVFQATAGNTCTVASYQTESATTAGNAFTALLRDSGNTMDMSPETAAQTVKIDLTDPIPGATFDTNTGLFIDDSDDFLSGLKASDSKIAIVLENTTPNDSDYVAFNAATLPPVGAYDVYVWAWDNAGNDAKAKAISSFLVSSSDAPTITGALETGPDAGAPHASNAWTNQDVKVTVTPPIPEIGGTYYSALYHGATQEAKAMIIQMPVSKVYSAETAGTTLFGRLVSSADGSLSNDSSSYVVRIDKTNPVAGLTYNAGPDFDFTDVSVDNLSSIANSGVAETLIKIVPAGESEPVRTAYAALSAADVLPATGYWDVWAIAVDNAGNESLPTRAFEHISRDGLDQIDALDFAWDIASGSAGLDDAMAKMLSHVEGLPQGSLTPYPLSSISVNASDLAAVHSAINSGQKGTSWNLEFSTPVGPAQASTTIKVTLFDSGPGPGPNPPPGPLAHELIYANHFNWGISAGDIDDNEAKGASFVRAYDEDGNLISVAVLGVDQTELGDINDAIARGEKDTIWPLTFSTPDNTTTTINVTLFDNSPVNPPQPGAEHIVGNNFNWGISTGALDEASAEMLGRITATSATGASLDLSHVDASAADLVAINAAIAAGQKGTTWPLTFTTDGSTGAASAAIIQVTLFDAGPAGPLPSGVEHVVGNDFNWGISTGALDEASAEILGSVAATSATRVNLDLSHVDASVADLAAINAAIAAGQKGTTWPLTFTTDGSTGASAAATILVTLFDNGPQGPLPSGAEHVVGNDFNWGISTGALDEASAEILGRVAATSATSAPLALSHVDASAADLAAINAAIAAGQKNTTYPLTFTTDGSTGTASSVTIQVTLYDNGPQGPMPSGAEHVVGNDFNWGISTGALDEVSAEILGCITATSATGSPLALSHVSASAADLAAINAGSAGETYPLTFTTDGSTGTASSAIINVTLFDAGPATPPVAGQPHIVANDFNWRVDKGVIDANAAKLASLVSALTSSAFAGNAADITVDQTELAAINTAIAAGLVSATPFDLTFTYTDPATLLTVTAIAKVSLLGSSDIEITKTADKDAPLPGETITYTLTVANNGIATAQGVWIKDYVPANTSFVSCDVDGVYGATAGGKDFVNWFIPTLPAGQQKVLTMTVKVDECTPGTKLSNIALFEETGSTTPPNNMATTDPGPGQSNPAISTVAEANKPATKGFPFTGDGVSMLMIVCALCALGALGTFFVARKRRKEQ